MSANNDGYNPIANVKGFMALVIVFIHGWAAMLQAWTRWPGTCGPDYFGKLAVFGWVWAGIFPLFWPVEETIAIYYWFSIATLVLFGVHRFQSRKLQRSGVDLHSHCMGAPWVCKLIPGINLDRAFFLEGLLQTLVGLALLPVSGNLSRFWIMGMFANCISHMLVQERDRRRAIRMKDAWLEQRQQAETFQHFTRKDR